MVYSDYNWLNLGTAEVWAVFIYKTHAHPHVRPHLTFTACISHCTGQFFDEFVSVLWFHSLLSTQRLDQSHTFLKRGEHTVHWPPHNLFYPESMMSSSIQDSPGLRSLYCVVIGWDSLWGHFYSSNCSVLPKQIRWVLVSQTGIIPSKMTPCHAWGTVHGIVNAFH